MTHNRELALSTRRSDLGSLVMTSDGMEAIDTIKLASSRTAAEVSMMHTSAVELAQFTHPILFKKTYLFTAKLRLSSIV
jgi:hypothetical protein